MTVVRKRRAYMDQSTTFRMILPLDFSLRISLVTPSGMISSVIRK